MKILADENIPQIDKLIQFLIQSGLMTKFKQSTILSLVEDQIKVSYL